MKEGKKGSGKGGPSWDKKKAQPWGSRGGEGGEKIGALPTKPSPGEVFISR